MDDADYQALSDRATVVLESIDLDRYYGDLSLTDEAVAALGSALAEAAPEQRATFSAGLTAQGRRVLGRFMLRCPMLALRRRDAAWLRSGLLVRAVLEQEMHDWRDDLVAMAPYHCVAQELGQQPVELFDHAAGIAVPELAEVMRTFGRRQDVTLGAFGWRRLETPDGATLEMLGWKGQPSGAVVGSPSWEAVNGALARELLEWVRSQRRGKGTLDG